MNQRRRMYRSLGGLSVAMTGTAAVLAWMDPSIPSHEAELSPAELARWADAVVTEDVKLAAGVWGEIEVLADESLTSRAMLAAGLVDSGAHFHVDAFGRLSRTSAWEVQTPADGNRPSIRIVVSLPRETQRLSGRQWSSIQALLRSLDATGVLPTYPATVRVGPDLVERPEPLPVRRGLVSQAAAFSSR